MRIGTYGLFFFIVGYARLMNDLHIDDQHADNGTRWKNQPRSVTMRRCLAEQEPELLQAFVKDVFARHDDCDHPVLACCLKGEMQWTVGMEYYLRSRLELHWTEFGLSGCPPIRNHAYVIQADRLRFCFRSGAGYDYDSL